MKQILAGAFLVMLAALAPAHAWITGYSGQGLNLADRRGVMLVVGANDNASSSNGGDPTITFSPAPTIGDFVLVCGGFGDTADGAEILTAGYSANDIFDGDNATTVAIVCSYKFLTSAETTVQGEGGAGAADSVNYGSYVFRGVNTTTPMDTAAVVTSDAAAGAVDCGTITPVTAGSMLVCACLGLVTDVTGVTAPSGYTDLINVTVNDTDDTSTAFSIARVNAPGVATGTVAYGGYTNAVNVCVHIALRPAD
jgi:hypothetical protein